MRLTVDAYTDCTKGHSDRVLFQTAPNGESLLLLADASDQVFGRNYQPLIDLVKDRFAQSLFPSEGPLQDRLSRGVEAIETTMHARFPSSEEFGEGWYCTEFAALVIENDSSHEGMIEGLSVGSYVLLIDFTGRLFRDGKAAISAEVAGILERLGSSAESWWSRIEKLSNGRPLGRFFAVNRQRLRDVARRLGVHHLANLGGCVARSINTKSRRRMPARSKFRRRVVRRSTPTSLKSRDDRSRAGA
jgi:hypothetical protein